MVFFIFLIIYYLYYLLIDYLVLYYHHQLLYIFLIYNSLINLIIPRKIKIGIYLIVIDINTAVLEEKEYNIIKKLKK